MPPVRQNRRRTPLSQPLARARFFLSKGWDWYLLGSGYGVLFGLLGLAVVGLPGSTHPVQPWREYPTQGAFPSATHWFGIDGTGADLMGPLLKQAGASVWLALIAVGGGTLVGLGLGTAIAWLSRGRGQRLLSRADQSLSANPALAGALVLAWGWGPGFWTVAAVLGSLCAGRVTTRSAAWYQEMDWQGHVLASRSLGASRWRLIGDHLGTHFWKRAAATAATLLPGALLAESALAFVLDGRSGLGHLMAIGRQCLFEAPWMLIAPGLALSLIAILLAWLGWAVRRTVRESMEERLW